MSGVRFSQAPLPRREPCSARSSLRLARSSCSSAPSARRSAMAAPRGQLAPDDRSARARGLGIVGPRPGATAVHGTSADVSGGSRDHGRPVVRSRVRAGDRTHRVADGRRGTRPLRASSPVRGSGGDRRAPVRRVRRMCGWWCAERAEHAVGVRRAGRIRRHDGPSGTYFARSTRGGPAWPGRLGRAGSFAPGTTKGPGVCRGPSYEPGGQAAGLPAVSASSATQRSSSARSVWYAA